MTGIENLYFIKELTEFANKKFIPESEKDELIQAYAKLDQSLQESNEMESNMKYMYATFVSEAKASAVQLERRKEYHDEKESDLKKLQEVYKQYEFELDNLDTQVLLFNHEIINKEGERNSMTQDLEDRKRKEEEDMKPEIKKHTDYIEVQELEIKHIKESLESCKYEKEARINDTSELKQENEKLEKEVVELTKDASEKKSDPKSYEEYRSLLISINSKLAKEKADIINTSLEKDRKLVEIQKKIEQLQTEADKLKDQNQLNKEAEDQINLNLDEVKEEVKKVVETKGIYETKIYDTVVEIKSIKDKMIEIKSLKDYNKKIFFNYVKDFKRKENHLNKLKESIGTYEESVKDYEENLAKITVEIKERNKYISHLDLRIKDLEEAGKTKTENMQMLKDELRRKKSEIEVENKNFYELQKNEQAFKKEIKHLIIKIERSARQAAQCRAEYQDAYREGKIKDVMIFDLAKKLKETQTRHRQYEVLYEEIKNARNKKVLEIQNSSQELADMKDRLKILNSEVEILREESSEKEKSLTKAKHNVQVEINIRDNLRSFLSKQQLQLQQKKTELGRQVAEIEKLNANIDSLESEMRQQRKDYEIFCKERNLKGVQLIDRNDELCILYETSNMLEEQIRQGEKSMANMNDDMRMLNIQLNDGQRSLELLKKKMVQIPELSEQVVKLKAKNEEYTVKVAELTLKLENPDPSRRRELKSEEPDPKALETKISVYEELLNMKKEQLLEKELILEEITMKSDELRKRALDNRDRTIEIADRINKFQGEIKKLTKKRMALISELSMFQALSLKQEQNIEEIKEKYNISMGNIEKGQDPNMDLVEEWNKMERIRIWKEKDEIENAQMEANKVLLPPGVTKSHAEPRPNAYYSVDMSVPIPYGAYAPFKPSEPGANMRFFRKPKKREIEL